MTTTNLDPKPLVSDTGVRFAVGAAIPGLSGHHDPRPEFDVGDNPILGAYAEMSPGESRDNFASAVLKGSVVKEASAQAEHARAVLELIIKEA